MPLRLTGQLPLAQELADEYPDLPRRYWALWRLMLLRLREGFNATAGHRDPLGQAWELLPADTRVPDHSIWDHLRAASAFAGA